MGWIDELAPGERIIHEGHLNKEKHTAKRRSSHIIGKAAVVVANHTPQDRSFSPHHHDIYSATKEDGIEKLKVKLSGYKLSALSSYLPQ